MYRYLLVVFLSASKALIAQSTIAMDWDSLHIYTSLEEAQVNPDKVYRLHMTKAKLRSFPIEILKFPHLIDLNLEKNKIDSIPSQIKSLQMLEKINFAHNNISNLPETIWSLPKLKSLNAADNLLGQLTTAVENSPQLEELILYDNPLEEYPYELSTMTELKVLDLLHNNISYATQDRLREMLPDCQVIMSPPCNCADGQ
jgi:Leucine-rich repeat (LRR) protein